VAAQRGWSIEETANKLLEVSAKAQERARLHDEGYALITAQNAAAAVTRGRQAGRGQDKVGEHKANMLGWPENWRCGPSFRK
jgi:hypothetical protein